MWGRPAAGGVATAAAGGVATAAAGGVATAAAGGVATAAGAEAGGESCRRGDHSYTFLLHLSLFLLLHISQNLLHTLKV